MLVEQWDSLVTPDDLVAFHYENWRLIGNPALAAWMLCSPWEYSILCSLAQHTPCAQVIDQMSQLFGETPADAALRVEKVLAQYLLRWIIYLPHTRPAIHVPQPTLRQVYYAVTEGCNLRCPYCYASSEKALPGELTPAESLSVVDQAADLGCQEFILTGGEPLLRRDLFEIAAHVRRRGMRANIITNGTVIKTPEIAQRMSELFNLVTVSIDGGTAEIHESTRGKGTFKAVKRALQLLNDVGIEPNINHVVTPNNADYIDQLDQMLSQFNIRRVRLMLHGPLGRGLFDDAELAWADYMKIHRFTWGSPTAKIIVPDGPKRPKPGSVQGNCGLGGNEIYINSLGDVYPCKLITSSQYKAGNVRERSLRDIYLGSESLQDLRTISVDTLLGCKTCYIRGGCGGGCRAYHMGYSGDVKVSASKKFCPTLRHQMISSIWASFGITGMPLIEESQAAYFPILVKTGDKYPVPGETGDKYPVPDQARTGYIPLQTVKG